MSPWPLSGMGFTIYEMRLALASASPGLFAGIMVNARPLVKRVEAVYCQEATGLLEEY